MSDPLPSDFHTKPKPFWFRALPVKLAIIIVGLLILTDFLFISIIKYFHLQYGYFIIAALIGALLILGYLSYSLLTPLLYLQKKLDAWRFDPEHPERYLMIPRYKGEMNTLVIKVNELLRKLGDAYRNIKSHEMILEMRIEERTKELTQLANYDIITELPNRNLLKENITQACVVTQQERNMLVIFMLELLDFHEIVNAYGHNIGNIFLKEIAKYLTNNLPAQTMIAHTSTAQFAIVRSRINNHQQMSSLAQWILDLFTKPIMIANNNIVTTLNIGIAIFPNDAEEAENLIVNANLALTRAQANTPNSFQFYESGMNTIVEARRTTLVDLHYAVRDNQLRVFYQPQIDLKTKKIIGAESLVRWQHPEKGLLSPGLFIPLAEESGLVISIGEWVLQTVCQQLKRWQKTELANLCIAVNLSALQFRQKGIIETVHQIITKNAIQPELLELEITESAIMNDMEEAIATMKALHALGTPIALDDFGTGYSSLSYVKQFPLQKLKIDQSFVREIVEQSGSNPLAAIIIQLAKSMNLRTIAEGIETKIQANYLVDKGCDEGQGYLYGKPMPVEEFEALVCNQNIDKDTSTSSSL